MSDGKAPDYEVWTIIEREGHEDFWQRLGSAWTNKDGSINVKLNGLPVNGGLQLRSPRDRDGDE